MEVQCTYCGKTVHRKPSQARTNYFCCREHHQAYITNSTKQKCNCNHCGKELDLTRQRRQRSKTGLYFCDTQCRNTYVAKHSRWKDNPNSHRTRIIFLRETGKVCDHCGYGETLDMLDVHHIDEDRSNNQWSNLSLLCVWCHTLLHRKVDSFSIAPVYCSTEEAELAFQKFSKNQSVENHRIGTQKRLETNAERYGYEVSVRVDKKCLCCDKEFVSSKLKQKYCSPECSAKAHRKIERPSKEELENLLANNSYVAVGKMYGVTDNTIRGWRFQ